MRHLCYGPFLKSPVRSFFTLGRLVETALCRLPYGSYRYAHSPSTRQLTEKEEEELVRNLVQDAFSPSMGVSKSSSSGSQLKGVCQDIRSTNPTLGAGGSGRAFESADTDRCTGSSDALHAAETDSRAVNKACEKFARVRLRAHAYTIEELKDISNREANIEWMCMHCQTFNYLGRRSCRHCGASELNSHRVCHLPARHVASFPTSWICEGCGHPNNTNELTSSNLTRTLVSPSIEALSRSTTQKHRFKFFCAQCSQPFGGVREWYCPYCDHINSKASTQCSTCLAERPVLWKCDGCGHASNSIFSTSCFMCKQHRPMKVSNSTVLCPGCGARNDCRWELCEACMSPLPAMIETMQSEKFNRQVTPAPDRVPSRRVDPVASLPQRRSSESQAGRIQNDLQEGKPAEPCTASVVASHWPLPTTGETSGAWWCTQCNLIQRRNATFCDVCLQPRHLAEESGAALSDGKTSASGASVPREKTPPSLPPMGSWQCPYCRQFKDAKTRECCGKMRELRRGYWLCLGCSSVNRQERVGCIGCGGPPPTAAAHWRCAVCNFDNPMGDLLCRLCGTAAHTTRKGKEGEPTEAVWHCAACRSEVPEGAGESCPSCGAAKPRLPAPVRCPVCHAPNAVPRRACFRCRARLDGGAVWRCARCQAAQADRRLSRCPACRAPRRFHEAEETWGCTLCGTAVASGGDLPIREECPKCHAARSPGGAVVPSRWRCVRCGLPNRTARPRCAECGAARVMPPGRHARLFCPHCFGPTAVDAAEHCEHCGGGLTDALTAAAGGVDQVEGEEGEGEGEGWPSRVGSRKGPGTALLEWAGPFQAAEGSADAASWAGEPKCTSGVLEQGMPRAESMLNARRYELLQTDEANDVGVVEQGECGGSFDSKHLEETVGVEAF